MALIVTNSGDLGSSRSRILDHLTRRYGEDTVLVLEREIDPLARSFRLSLAGALIVIICPTWFAPTIDDFRPLDNEDDPVTSDIRAALQLGIPVVLALIDGAIWPNPQDLPPSLRDPALGQIVEVHDGKELQHDLDRLVRTLDRILDEAKFSVGFREDVLRLEEARGSFFDIEKSAPPEDGGESANTNRQSSKLKDPTEAALSAIQDSLSLPNAESSGPAVQLPRPRILPADASMSERAWPSVRSGKTANAKECRESIEFGVAYPAAVTRNRNFLVDVWLFRPDDRGSATSSAMRQRPGSSEFRTGSSASVLKGSRLSVQLQVHPWKVDPDIQTLVWTGEMASVSFRVTPDVELQADTVIGDCKIFLNGLRIGQVFFELSLASRTSQTHFERSEIISTAFASYAANDRSRVLARVQGIEKVGVRVFMDVRDLRSGAHYPTQLFSQIDCSDVLYLFWSRHAKNSKWVTREWRYGMETRGVEFIDPVPLTDPRKVTPPPELSSEKHFNDWTLAYAEYENSLSLWHRLRQLIASN
jgi:hypothetical protein